MKKTRNLLKHFKTSMHISWKASPWMFLARIVFELVSISIPILSSYIFKEIIDNLSYARDMDLFIRNIALFAILQFASMIYGRVSGHIAGVHSELVSRYIRLEIIEKINELDLSYFDIPDFYNEIQNASRDSKSLLSLTWTIVSIVKGIVQSIVCGIILAQMLWVFPFVILAMDIPGVMIARVLNRKKYDWQLRRTDQERRIGYYESVMQGRAFAKDVRIWDSKPFFMKKYLALWKDWFREKNKIERERIGLTLISSTFPFLVNIMMLVYIGIEVIGGRLTIGDFTYYRSISSQYRSGLEMFLSTINDSYDSEMRLSHYADFLSWKSRVPDEGILEVNRINTVEFRNVSFSYPNTNREVLHNLSFRIDENEKLAVVGYNGAGKTTLIKLLLRLYDPVSGDILINGRNIKEYTLKSLRNNFSTVFQDYNRYELPVDETVALADTKNPIDKGRVIRACLNANLDVTKPEDYPKTTDTYLGKLFDKEGVILSGGQWQKVAIAQAYYKRGNFMIMDEPNASLDPKSEHIMFEKLKELSQDRSGLIVTHRLSSVFMADRILVINSGHKEAIGTHTELMQQCEIYRNLFNMQAEHYRKESRI